MALRIGDTAPDFEAETTEGKIRFHEWLGDSWGILFSHPKDFTPICTTELGTAAKLKPDFDRRNVKLIGLSADPVDSHGKWAKDIEETQGTALNFPMIGDADLKVSKLYDMLPAAADPSGPRTAADNQTVRTVYVIGPDKKIKLMIAYPMSTGRNFDEILRAVDSIQLTAKFKVATPANWKVGRGRGHRRFGQQRRGQEDLAGRLEGAQALYPHRAAAEVGRAHGDGEFGTARRTRPRRFLLSQPIRGRRGEAALDQADHRPLALGFRQVAAPEGRPDRKAHQCDNHLRSAFRRTGCGQRLADQRFDAGFHRCEKTIELRHQLAVPCRQAEAQGAARRRRHRVPSTSRSSRSAGVSMPAKTAAAPSGTGGRISCQTWRRRPSQDRRAWGSAGRRSPRRRRHARRSG